LRWNICHLVKGLEDHEDAQKGIRFGVGGERGDVGVFFSGEVDVLLSIFGSQ
jgi:hypothetical protein